MRVFQVEEVVNGQTAGGVFLIQPGRVPNRQPAEQGRRFPVFGGSSVSSAQGKVNRPYPQLKPGVLGSQGVITLVWLVFLSFLLSLGAEA